MSEKFKRQLINDYMTTIEDTICEKDALVKQYYKRKKDLQ